MKRIIYLITVVLAIIILQSCCRNCFLGRYTRYKFDETYKPDLHHESAPTASTAIL